MSGSLLPPTGLACRYTLVFLVAFFFPKTLPSVQRTVLKQILKHCHVSRVTQCEVCLLEPPKQFFNMLASIFCPAASMFEDTFKNKKFIHL